MQRESGDDPQSAQDRVRRDLADLGADTASAPPVPPEVTAAVHAALRSAPPLTHRVIPGATSDHRPDRPAVRWRRPAAAAGLLATVVALAFGVFALVRQDSADGFAPDPGPTARHITAHRDAMPLTDAEILALLRRPADTGALGDPERCLTGLGYPAGTPVLGATPVPGGGRPVILLVVPAPNPADVLALTVGPDCPAAGSGVAARTELPRS